MKKLSVIVPCYNEQDVLNAFYDEISEMFKKNDGYAYELLFVNDGSKDSTQGIIESLANKDECVKYISFSRNFGKEAGMLAGLENCTGDYACFIDADLQHDPALIPEMLKAVDEEGYDVAACRRVDRKGENKFKSMLSGAFYKIVNKISETYIDDGAQDFRVMNRNVINSILSMKENIRFTKGIFSWVGFNVKWFPHENRERVAGNTKWSVTKLMKYALDGIIGYTASPLRIPLYFGGLSILASFMYAIYVVIQLLTINYAIPLVGRFLLFSVLFGIGLILISIGIVGEYLARIYTEVKDRPKYLIAKTNCNKSEE